MLESVRNLGKKARLYNQTTLVFRPSLHYCREVATKYRGISFVAIFLTANIATTLNNSSVARSNHLGGWRNTGTSPWLNFGRAIWGFFPGRIRLHNPLNVAVNVSEVRT